MSIIKWDKHGVDKQKCIDVYHKYKLNDNDKNDNNDWTVITKTLTICSALNKRICICFGVMCVLACYKIVWRFNQQSNYAGGPDLEHKQVTTNG